MFQGLIMLMLLTTSLIVLAVTEIIYTHDHKAHELLHVVYAKAVLWPLFAMSVTYNLWLHRQMTATKSGSLLNAGI